MVKAMQDVGYRESLQGYSGLPGQWDDTIFFKWALHWARSLSLNLGA